MAKEKSYRRDDLLATQVAVRFPNDLLDRLERYVQRLKKERPGLNVSRADAVRMIVHERLDQIEAEDSKKKPRG